MRASSRSPSKLSIDDFVAKGLAGRRFEAREGRTFVRGVIMAVSADADMLRIDVSDIERRQADRDWGCGTDFDYQGQREQTSIWLRDDGGFEVDIQFIGAIHIHPGAST